MSINGNVVGTQQRAAEPAVVAARVALIHRYYEQPVFRRLYVLLGFAATKLMISIKHVRAKYSFIVVNF